VIALHFENLILFIPQYLLSTLGAIAIYLYLGRKLPGWQYTIPFIRRTRRLGTSADSTLLKYPSPKGSFFLPCNVSVYDRKLNGLGYFEEPFFDLLFYFSLNGLPPSVYSIQVFKYEKPPVYESAIVYEVYRIMLAVSSWAGLLLFITPFSYIYVFLPHFSDPYNIIVAIILSIAIFEGVLSTIFFRIGVSLGKIMLVEGFVIVAFTISILSPSMSWLDLFAFSGRLIIYLVLLSMFTIIAALISQLRTMKNLFLSSLLFSTISYFSFVIIVLYNVMQILGF
jgi:hypothetical protein